MKACHLLVLWILVFSALAGLHAQSSDATLTGRVTDPTKALISGAKVDVINAETNVKYSTTTNSDGMYSLPSLPPGNYRMEVEKIGFKTIIRPDIVLHVQDVIAINFDMSVGSISESMTVEGGAPLVNTENATVGTVIDQQFVENLPLNGRSFNTLLQLTPGVVIVPSNSVAPGQFSINGQRTDGNYFSVDGVSVNFSSSSQTYLAQGGNGGGQAFNAFGGTSSLVSVDAMQEFRVETSSFAPEYGHTPGGQVLITTRSGTNDFRGSAFDYFRNDILDANDWFANRAGLPRAAERQNDFGGVFGGPISHDRTFFSCPMKACGCGNHKRPSSRCRLPAFARMRSRQLNPFWMPFQCRTGQALEMEVQRNSRGTTRTRWRWTREVSGSTIHSEMG